MRAALATRAARGRGVVLLALAVLPAVTGCAPPAPGVAGESQSRRPQAGEPLFGEQPARPLDLRAALSADEVALLGDVELCIDLFVETGAVAEFAPELPADFATHGADEAPVVRAVEGGEWRRYRIRLRPTRTGTLEVPQLSARTEDGAVATSRALSLEVGSVLSEPDSDVEAPAPPFPARFDWQPWALAAAVALICFTGLWYWLRRRRGQRSPVAATPLPPHVTALRALGRLRNAPRTTAAEVEQFYVEVSRILRTYLEQRFALRAPERTTEEFLLELRSGDTLTVAQREQLAEFLAQCDLVKFARAQPAEEVHARTFEVAEQFVEATRGDRQGAESRPEVAPAATAEGAPG